MLPAGHSREPFAGRKTNDSDFGPKHYEAVCPLPPQKIVASRPSPSFKNSDAA
jgi:hypothetical protein